MQATFCSRRSFAASGTCNRRRFGRKLAEKMRYHHDWLDDPVSVWMRIACWSNRVRRVRKDRTNSIHIQPLDGLATTRDVFGEDFASQRPPDGSKVAVVRQHVDSDVVLLRDGAAHRGDGNWIPQRVSAAGRVRAS